MEKWLQITKIPKLETEQEVEGGRLNMGESRSLTRQSRQARYKPYDRTKSTFSKSERVKPEAEEGLNSATASASTASSSEVEPNTKPVKKISTAALTKHLIKTLKDESNPLTHSDIYQRSDVIVSMTSGHQVADGRSGSRAQYFHARNSKLQVQELEQGRSTTQPLAGTRVYINGYLEDTTDIEMKRILNQAGAQVLTYPSRATHILTSHQLNASKTQKILTAKTKIHVVKPEWVYDSVDAGKRLAEAPYTIVLGTCHRRVLGSI